LPARRRHVPPPGNGHTVFSTGKRAVANGFRKYRSTVRGLCRFWKDANKEIRQLMDELKRLLDKLPPEKAMNALSDAVRFYFPLVSEKTRVTFLQALTGESTGDDITGLVHL